MKDVERHFIVGLSEQQLAAPSAFKHFLVHYMKLL